MTRMSWSLTLLALSLAGLLGGCSGETAVETSQAADLHTVALTVEGMT